MAAEIIADEIRKEYAKYPGILHLLRVYEEMSDCLEQTRLRGDSTETQLANGQVLVDRIARLLIELHKTAQMTAERMPGFLPGMLDVLDQECSVAANNLHIELRKVNIKLVN